MSLDPVTAVNFCGSAGCCTGELFQCFGFKGKYKLKSRCFGGGGEQIHTAIYKTDEPQGPPSSTGNYIRCLVTTYKGKESEKEWLYIEMNHFAATWNTVNQLYFNFKKGK